MFVVFAVDVEAANALVLYFRCRRWSCALRIDEENNAALAVLP